jgi:hypoxanthine phosphoribosyltransferase
MKILISESEIKKRVKALGERITADYKGKKPIFIGILNGCYVFMADLLREVELDAEVDFVKIRSYEGDSSTGTIKFRKDISADIDGRDIIIVEDIIDSGFTINFLVKRLRNSGPKSVSVATILFKKEVAKLDFEVDYVGFEIPPEFVVGYGLDYDEKYRHLKDVMVMESKDLETN